MNKRPLAKYTATTACLKNENAEAYFSVLSSVPTAIVHFLIDWGELSKTEKQQNACCHPTSSATFSTRIDGGKKPF